jgi:DNA-binding NarL/FixJ family response regulator
MATVLSPTPVRILVVDDHLVVREGTALLVRHDPSLRVVGHARTAAEGLSEAARLRPTLVLLDLRLPDQPTATTIGALKAAVPGVRVLLFTAHAGAAALAAALGAGADGYLLKDTTRADLVAAIRTVAAGGRWLDPRADDDHATWPGLSAREHEVLRRVALGETNPEIATALTLSRNTVKSYLTSAMQKLGARNRVDAIMRAHDHGLL